MEKQSTESGYRVVFGEKKTGLIFMSLPCETAEQALEQHGPSSCMLGIGVIRSNTIDGALKLAKSCVFKL